MLKYMVIAFVVVLLLQFTFIIKISAKKSAGEALTMFYQQIALSVEWTGVDLLQEIVGKK